MNYGPFITKAQAKAQGLRYYFDGSTCRKGHTDTREINDGGTRCVKCRQARVLANYYRDKQDPAKYEKRLSQAAERKRDRRARRTPEQREAELAARREAKTPEQRERDRISALRRYYETPREIRRAAEKRWVEANRERYNARVVRWQQRYKEQNPSFKIACSYRSYISSRIAKVGGRKSAKFEALVGCTKDQLVAHLEAQFTEGMSWENYGEWHIDHIRPCASFDLIDPAQQYECFHFSNLQPMWALENIKKGAAWAPKVDNQAA